MYARNIVNDSSVFNFSCQEVIIVGEGENGVYIYHFPHAGFGSGFSDARSLSLAIQMFVSVPARSLNMDVTSGESCCFPLSIPKQMLPVPFSRLVYKLVYKVIKSYMAFVFQHC